MVKGKEIKILVFAFLLLGVSFFYTAVSNHSRDIFQATGMAVGDPVYWMQQPLRYFSTFPAWYFLVSQETPQDVQLHINGKRIQFYSYTFLDVGTVIMPRAYSSSFSEGKTLILADVTTQSGKYHEEAVVQKDSEDPLVEVLEQILDGDHPYVKIKITDRNPVLLNVRANVNNQLRDVTHFISVESQSWSEETGGQAIVSIPLRYVFRGSGSGYSGGRNSPPPPKVVLVYFADTFGNGFNQLFGEDVSNAVAPGELPSISAITGYQTASGGSTNGVSDEEPPKVVCGNNKKEGAEQCDGTDPGACIYGCTTQCTCKEHPPILLWYLFKTNPPCNHNGIVDLPTEECEGSGTQYCPAGKRCNPELCKCEQLTGKEIERRTHFYVDAYTVPDVDPVHTITQMFNFFAWIWYKYIDHRDLWDFDVTVIRNSRYTTLEIDGTKFPEFLKNLENDGYKAYVDKHPNDQNIFVFNAVKIRGEASVLGYTFVNPANTPFVRRTDEPTDGPLGTGQKISSQFNVAAQQAALFGAWPSFINLGYDKIRAQGQLFAFEHEKFHEMCANPHAFDYYYGFNKREPGFWYDESGHLAASELGDKVFIRAVSVGDGFIMAKSITGQQNLETHARKLRLSLQDAIIRGAAPDRIAIKVCRAMMLY